MMKLRIAGKTVVAKMTNFTKPSQMLRKAASILNSDLKKAKYCRQGACDALYRVVYNTNGSRELHDVFHTASERLASLFKPVDVVGYRGGCARQYWFGAKFSKEQQEHRIIALLLTADMCESVGE